MASCIWYPDICEKFAESSPTVNLRPLRNTFSIVSIISSVNWMSFAPLIIICRRTTVFKLTTPFEHNRTIHIFITVCRFYLIINLNPSFSLPNEITYDPAYFAFSGKSDWLFHETYFRVDSFQRIHLKPVSLLMGGIRLNGSVANMSKKSLRPWEPQYT